MAKQFCAHGHDRTLPDALYDDGHCKACVSTRDRDRYLAGKISPARSKYSRNRRLRQRYGIDEEYYECLLKEQEGKCYICESFPAGNATAGILHVDHDHITGEIRGLLCTGCNTGLGCFGDDPQRLLKAIQYLIRKRF